MRAGNGVATALQEREQDLMPWIMWVKIFAPTPSKYINYEPRFISVFSGDNLPRMKDGAYVMNLDDRKIKGTHWASLFLTETKLRTLIRLEFNIFLKNY